MDEDLDEGKVPELTLEEELAGAIGLTEEDSDTVDPVAPAPAEPAPAKPGEPAADAEAAPPVDPAAAKPVDPAKAADADMYAPLPEHNPRKTHERFAKLVEGHKAVSQERDTIAQEREQLRGRIQEYEQGLDLFREMGFNTQEAVADLQQFSQYRRALSSGNVDQAIGLLQQQIRQLSLATGRRIEVNPLESFQDLNQRHLQGEIDEPTAMELARSRHIQQVQQAAQQRSQQAHQQEAQQAQVIHAAAQSVDQVAVELQRDPDYKQIEPALLAALPDIKANYHPTQWAREVKRAYDTEARFLRLQAQQQVQRTPQPIRGNGHGGGRPAPASAGDAVLQALGLD